MKTIKQLILFTAGAVSLFALACKKDKTTKDRLPELVTTEVTNIVGMTASGGGVINTNGGETIAYSGLCWSKTNSNPTVSDDTTKSSISGGAFTAMLKNLTPSTTYSVRAYAVNRNGTGYGNVITFSTGNGAPVASNVSINGDARADAVLTANYTYSDHEGDAESGTIFQWYTTNDAMGGGETVIVGATAKTFRITDAQQGKYIRVGVVPKATIGTTTGIEVKSAVIGAVGEATTVTFMYNGASVTYGIILRPSGKKWLDRNLGAQRVAQSINDYQAYGDLFQWGRSADGHQLTTWTSSTAVGVTGITSTTAPFDFSNQDVPTTNKFIVIPDGSNSGDWRNPSKNGLWQATDGINNPCPAGWRIPTEAEWLAEGINSSTDAYSKLKLTYNGQRVYQTGISSTHNFMGNYWSSSTGTRSGKIYSVGIYFGSEPDGSSTYPFSSTLTNRGRGNGCRCIKN